MNRNEYKNLTEEEKWDKWKEWEAYLREVCHCYPDAFGNRPCDNGFPCDRCMY